LVALWVVRRKKLAGAIDHCSRERNHQAALSACVQDLLAESDITDRVWIKLRPPSRDSSRLTGGRIMRYELTDEEWTASGDFDELR
jgi:hypothetical protein